MMQSKDVIVVEADLPDNGDLYFRPLHNRIRGRLDFQRCPEPEVLKVARKWPRSEVPGQRIELDTAKGTAAVIEPLHAPEFELEREKIADLGYTLAPERTEYPRVDTVSWTFWLWRAVQAGFARVVQGKLPDDPPKPPPRRRASVDDEELAKLRAEVAELRELIAKRGAK